MVLYLMVSYQTQCSTRLSNKRNMRLEGIAVLFLCPRADVAQLRQVISEANEHTYGMLQQLLREFTLEQPIYLVKKVNQVTKAIYDGSLLPGVSHKGYQATFQEYMKIVTEASSRMPKREVQSKLIQPILLWISFGTMSEIS